MGVVSGGEGSVRHYWNGEKGSGELVGVNLVANYWETTHRERSRGEFGGRDVSSALQSSRSFKKSHRSCPYFYATSTGRTTTSLKTSLDIVSLYSSEDWHSFMRVYDLLTC